MTAGKRFLDSDFMASTKVVRLDKMDDSTRAAAAVIRQNALVITDFAAGSKNVLLLRRS